MGFSYHAHTVVGVYLPMEKIAPSESKPSCKHSAVARAGKFCSDCGKRVEMVEVTNDKWSDAFAMGSRLGKCTSVGRYEGDRLVGYYLGLNLYSSDYDEGGITSLGFEDANPEEAARLINDWIGKNGLPLDIFRVSLENIEIHNYLDAG